MIDVCLWCNFCAVFDVFVSGVYFNVCDVFGVCGVFDVCV